MVNFFTDRLYRDADSIPLSSSHSTHPTHTSYTLHSTHSLHTAGSISDDMLLYCLKDLHQALASPGIHSNTLSTTTNITDASTPTTPLLPMNDTTNNINNAINTTATVNNINNGGADVELENDLIMQLRHQLLSSAVSPPIESLLVDYSPRLKYIG